LSSCFDSFKGCFQRQTSNVSTQAYHYLEGLFKSEKNRANCTAIAESLGQLNSQALNHVLTESPWDHKDVLGELADKVDALLINQDDVGLLIDEVGFRKKGKHSACVGRQYLGCLGKQDNGQVAVVAGLSSGAHYCPVDIELFMPQSWQEDINRRLKAKIPCSIAHRSKPEMALTMIEKLKLRSINFNYVGFDALYGSSYPLLKALDKIHVKFIGDVRENINMSLEPITFSLPDKKQGQKGRKFKHKQIDQQLVTTKAYMESLTNGDFELIAFRDGTKEKVKASFHRRKVWVAINNEESLGLELIIRKNLDGTVKYSLSNMGQLPLVQIAKRQGQRVFVERIFEEGKNQIGMGDYQVRSWSGFHKHMTLCFLAFYYLCEQKVKYEKDIKLTAPVIRKLVASTIVSRWESQDATIENCLNWLNQYQRQIERNLVTGYG